MTVLPRMPAEQTASWLGLLDLHEQLNEGWTLIGGQLVHLHCAERGQFPFRPTNDADTVIDVRADPKILRRFTKILTDLGFESAGSTAEGRQHRWKGGNASIDVLLPEGAGERPPSAALDRHGDQRRPRTAAGTPPGEILGRPAGASGQSRIEQTVCWRMLRARKIRQRLLAYMGFDYLSPRQIGPGHRTRRQSSLPQNSSAPPRADFIGIQPVHLAWLASAWYASVRRPGLVGEREPARRPGSDERVLRSRDGQPRNAGED
jgi:hypothetical protein